MTPTTSKSRGVISTERSGTTGADRAGPAIIEDLPSYFILRNAVRDFLKAKEWYDQVRHKESPFDEEAVNKALEDVSYTEVRMRDLLKELP